MDCLRAFRFLSTVNTSKFTVAILPLAKEFKKDTNTTAYLVSFSVLFLGFGNLLWVTVLRTLGQRPTFLLAMPLLAAANAWSARAESFGPLLAATIVGSLAAGGGEAPISAVVADLFFCAGTWHHDDDLPPGLVCWFFPSDLQ